MKTDYKQKAKDFLNETGTTFEITKAVPQKDPLWYKKGKKHGINYSVTLKNKQGSYMFDFWGSIRDAEYIECAKKCKEMRSTNNTYGDNVFDLLKENNIGIGMLRLQYDRLIEAVEKAVTPQEYDILACLNTLQEDIFEDFCSAFGYEEDSIIALKTFEACKEQDRNIRRMFTHDQIEKLTEIQ